MLKSSPGLAYENFDLNSLETVLKCDGINLILKNKYDNNSRLLIIAINLENLFPTLLLDFISYGSYGRLSTGVDRFVQIDIDDIFVGSSNKRMKPKDVLELVEFQENYLKQKIFNQSSNQFKFNLGFSGHYYQSGTHLENLGDQLLISNY